MAVGTLKTSTPSILSLDEIKRRLTPIFKVQSQNLWD
jgi:hypothetical protein